MKKSSIKFSSHTLSKPKEERNILDKLQNIGVSVFQVPTIEEISTGKSQINDLKPISISDLLEGKVFT